MKQQTYELQTHAELEVLSTDLKNSESMHTLLARQRRCPPIGTTSSPHAHNAGQTAGAGSKFDRRLGWGGYSCRSSSKVVVIYEVVKK